MPLEAASWINQLVPANPDGGDPLDNGDDHIRLVKGALKNSLPNIGGAVSATHTELSYVAGVTSAVQTQLNSKASLNSPAFTGDPTAPTQLATDSSTRIATTAFAKTMDSPAFTGSPTAPTPPLGDNSTRICTTELLAQTALSTFNPDVFTVITTSQPAAATGKYLVKASLTLTLPGSPASGTVVTCKSGYAGSFVVGRNGKNIGANGVYVAEDVTVYQEDGAVAFVYDGTNWEVF